MKTIFFLFAILVIVTAVKKNSYKKLSFGNAEGLVNKYTSLLKGLDAKTKALPKTKNYIGFIASLKNKMKMIRRKMDDLRKRSMKLQPYGKRSYGSHGMRPKSNGMRPRPRGMRPRQRGMKSRPRGMKPYGHHGMRPRPHHHFRPHHHGRKPHHHGKRPRHHKHHKGHKGHHRHHFRPHPHHHRNHTTHHNHTHHHHHRNHTTHHNHTHHHHSNHTQGGNWTAYNKENITFERETVEPTNPEDIWEEENDDGTTDYTNDEDMTDNDDAIDDNTDYTTDGDMTDDFTTSDDDFTTDEDTTTTDEIPEAWTTESDDGEEVESFGTPVFDESDTSDDDWSTYDETTDPWTSEDSTDDWDTMETTTDPWGTSGTFDPWGDDEDTETETTTPDETTEEWNPFYRTKDTMIPPFGKMWKKMFGNKRQTRFGNTFDKLKKVMTGLSTKMTGNMEKLSSVFPSTFDNMFKEIEKVKATVHENIKKTVNTLHSVVTSKPRTPCEFCNTVISYLSINKHMINASTTTVEATIKELCTVLKGMNTTDLCTSTITKLDTMMRLITNNTNSTIICEHLGISHCKEPETTFTSVTSTTTHTTKPTTCNEVCTELTTTTTNHLDTLTEELTQTEETLTTFCLNNKITYKCDNLLYMMGKLVKEIKTMQTSMETHTTTATKNTTTTGTRTNTTTETTTDITDDTSSYQTVSFDEPTESCRCLTTQPKVVMTAEMTSCELCKTLSNEYKTQMHKTIETLKRFTQLLEKDICENFPGFTDECMTIVYTLNLLIENEITTNSVCTTLGYCGVTHEKTTFEHTLMTTMKNMKDLFKVSPFLTRGVPMTRFNTKFTKGCHFCETCMEKLKETLDTVETTDMEKVLPTMKTSLGYMCTTMTSDDQKLKTVCEKIVNGMGSVHEMITKRMTNDKQELCRSLSLC